MCFAAAIGLFVFGVARWDWFLTELGAVFLGLMVLAAVLGGLGPNRVAREFGSGAAELTSAALIIGFARTIDVVMDDASIKDTVIHAIAGSLENLPAALASSRHPLVDQMFVRRTSSPMAFEIGIGRGIVRMFMVAHDLFQSGCSR